jgi:hypothetical protein
MQRLMTAAHCTVPYLLENEGFTFTDLADDVTDATSCSKMTLLLRGSTKIKG